jgi:stage IV sporulation protein FB
MLGAADHTQYDLRFRLLDIPVRVNPWFWLVMLMISGESRSLMGAVVFVLCAFVSILAHEYGHGLSARAFNIEPSEIVLYGMGGYCAYPSWPRETWQRVLTIFCGPLANFVVLSLALAGASLTYHCSPLDLMPLLEVGPVTEKTVDVYRQMLASGAGGRAIFDLIKINFLWGLLNLMPIWPLDGGRIAELGFGKINPRESTRWAHSLSLVAAGGIALWYASKSDWWMAVWFGYFGYVNYEILQGMHRSSRFGGGRWEY